MFAREYPFLLPFAALAAGLVIADQTGFCLPLYGMVAPLLLLAVSCLPCCRSLFLTACALCFLAIGLSAYPGTTRQATSRIQPITDAPHQSVILEGIVSSRPVETVSGANFLLAVDMVERDGRREQVQANLLLYLSEEEAGVHRGDRIRCAARIRKAGRSGLPGEFDYPRYLALHGVDAAGTLASRDDIVLIQGDSDGPALRRVDNVSERLGEFIRSAVPDVEASSVLSALLLGDQKRIPANLASQYTRAGVNHILSVSGFHIGIICYFIVSVTLFLACRCERLALRFNLRRVVLLLTLPGMLFYLLLTGSAPATARSVIMLAACVIALYAERETDPVNALLTAAFLLVAIDPPALFDISYQLSFLALWGIVIMVPPFMERCVTTEHGLLRGLIRFVAASCAASLATAVPVLLAFNQASLNGVITNFMVVPLLGYGAVVIGFCALPLVYLFPPLAQLLLSAAGKLVLLSNQIIRIAAELPVLGFHGITRLDMLLFLLAMGAATFLRKRRYVVLYSLTPAVMAVCLHVAAPSGGDGRLHVIMLSVGQAESLLLKLPDGSSALVDGGGYLHDTGRDFGARVLAPALGKLGIRRIDHMIMTHSHPDHVGGLPFVAGTLPVGTFWEAAPGGAGDQYERLRDELKRRKVPIKLLAAGDVVDLAPRVRLQVLSPQRAVSGSSSVTTDSDMNEDSLVFRMIHGNFRMLCTADAGFAAENRIMAESGDISADVLKVGHHGSRYSTSDPFLKRVNPRLAMISAGRDNRFGLPSQETVDQLRNRGIRIMRTDRDGTIELVSDGVSWKADVLVSPD